MPQTSQLDICATRGSRRALDQAAAGRRVQRRGEKRSNRYGRVLRGLREGEYLRRFTIIRPMHPGQFTRPKGLFLPFSCA